MKTAETETEIKFSKKDKADLPLLEQKYEQGGRMEAEAIREIRNRQLWRLTEFVTFDAYCAERWGHDASWVAKKILWINTIEQSAALGITIPNLSMRTTEALYGCEIEKIGGLKAIIEEAQASGKTISRDCLKRIVTGRNNFFSSEEEKPKAATYEEYLQDLAIVEPLYINQNEWLVGDFDNGEVEEGCEWTLPDIMQDCLNGRMLPAQHRLLNLATGDELKEVVFDLEGMKIDVKDAKSTKESLLQKKVDLINLKDKINELEDELIEAGEMKPKKEKPAPKPKPAKTIPFEKLVERDYVCKKITIAYNQLKEAHSQWNDDHLQEQRLNLLGYIENLILKMKEDAGNLVSENIINKAFDKAEAMIEKAAVEEAEEAEEAETEEVLSPEEVKV